MSLFQPLATSCKVFLFNSLVYKSKFKSLKSGSWSPKSTPKSIWSQISHEWKLKPMQSFQKLQFLNWIQKWVNPYRTLVLKRLEQELSCFPSSWQLRARLSFTARNQQPEPPRLEPHNGSSKEPVGEIIQTTSMFCTVYGPNSIEDPWINVIRVDFPQVHFYSRPP